jgi:hypothetical protein
MPLNQTTCGVVSAHIVIDCDKLPQAGVDKRIFLINYDDWKKAAITYDSGNAKIITGITLPATKKAYGYVGTHKSNGNKATFARQTHNAGWTHEVPFMIFKNNAATKLEIDKLPFGRYVVIVENDDKGTAGDMAFEVLGAIHGLELGQCDRDGQSTDNGGSWVCNFKTPDGKIERTPHIFHTFTSPSTTANYADSVTALEALLA